MGLLDNLDAMMDWFDRRAYGAERGSAGPHDHRGAPVYGAPPYGSGGPPAAGLSQPLAGLMPFSNMANPDAYQSLMFGQSGPFNMMNGFVGPMRPDAYGDGRVASAYPRWMVAPPASMANEQHRTHAPRRHDDPNHHPAAWRAPEEGHWHVPPRTGASSAPCRLEPLTAAEEAAQLTEALRRSVIDVAATTTAASTADPAPRLHAPAHQDLEREAIDTLFACMDSLNMAHASAAPHESARDWSLENSEFAHLYASDEDRRIGAESVAATRSASAHIRQAMHTAGAAPVPNDGKAHDSTNNCLVISLLQHATRDYGSDHAQFVSQYREILADQEDAPLPRNEPISALSDAAKRLIDLINADPGVSPKLRVAFISEFDGRMRVDEVGSKEPDARTVVIWDQGGHFEPVVPEAILHAAFAGTNVPSHGTTS